MEMEPSKPLDLSIQFTLPPSTSVAKMSILPNGDIVLLDENGHEITATYMDRTVHYSRPKGPKVVNRRAFQDQNTTVKGLKELTRFDSIFVIDTNTKQIGDEKISATCFVRFRILPHEENYRVECEPRLNFYEFHNVSGSAELLGVLKLANAVTRSGDYSTERSFAIVTDSCLDAHDAINAKHAPLYGSQTLPDGFHIMYASSDTGREVFNGIIKLCNRHATEYLLLYEQGGLPRRELQQLPEAPGVAYAYVSRKDLEITNPVISGLKLQEGATVTLFGLPHPPSKLE